MSSFYNTGLSGIKKLTKAQYDAMDLHDANTKYIVVGNVAVTEYLGDAPIGLHIVECTQEQYDAMQPHDANTLYAITGGSS